MILIVEREISFQNEIKTTFEPTLHKPERRSLVLKNQYFREMQRLGVKFRKGQKLTRSDLSHFDFCPPFSEGQSFAFKFWAIADKYGANEIIVDDLPKEEEIPIMINTFIQAGICCFVVKFEQYEILNGLKNFGYIEEMKECKVFRQDPYSHNERMEIIKGILVRIKT